MSLTVRVVYRLLTVDAFLKDNFPEVFQAIMRPGNGMPCLFVCCAAAEPTEIEIPSYTSVFAGDQTDRLKAVKTWLSEKGIRDLEAVSLYCDQLDKVSVRNIDLSPKNVD